MARRKNWTIGAQRVEDRVTGLVLDFKHDEIGNPVLAVITKDRARVAVFKFSEGLSQAMWDRQTMVHNTTVTEEEWAED